MKSLFTIFLLFSFGAMVRAQGHGPVYGLATPTLGKGHASFDAAAMRIRVKDQQSLMLRYIWSYGITQDLQVNLTTPTMIDKINPPPRTRGNSMMPSNGDIEASVYYRFHRNDFGIGKRFETTAILGGSIPTEKERGGIKVGNSLHAAVVTGYASRSIYVWMGSGYQYYFRKYNAQLGDLIYASAVFGYRPPLFKKDYPKPDWRIFVESLAEFPGKNRLYDGNGWQQDRGQKLLLGPTLLGLYGSWGISGGILWPVYQVVPDLQRENYRMVINLSYWL